MVPGTVTGSRRWTNHPGGAWEGWGLHQIGAPGNSQSGDSAGAMACTGRAPSTWVLALARSSGLGRAAAAPKSAWSGCYLLHMAPNRSFRDDVVRASDTAC